MQHQVLSFSLSPCSDWIGGEQLAGRKHNWADGLNSPKTYSISRNILTSNKREKRGLGWLNIFCSGTVCPSLPIGECLFFSFFFFFLFSLIPLHLLNNSSFSFFFLTFQHSFILFFLFSCSTGPDGGKLASSWTDLEG